MSASGANPILALVPCLRGCLVLALLPLFCLDSRKAAAKGVDCPPEMAAVAGRFCVDRWEASLDRLDERGRVLGALSPFHPPPAGMRWVARSRPKVMPQAHISQEQAAAACAAAGKRLCSDEEWILACQGRPASQYPYGNTEVRNRCNDHGVSPLRKLHGSDDSVFDIGPMNDPRLNQVPGSLARTGAFSGCRSASGAYDMVGNLHEWTAASQGTFRGGYYLDTHINGDGCQYQTTAHVPSYFDYSIGFRCCRDIGSAGRKNLPEPRHSRLPSVAGGAALMEHTVEKGQTLTGIAQRYRMSVKTLCEQNGLARESRLRIGQRLQVLGANRRILAAGRDSHQLGTSAGAGRRPSGGVIDSSPAGSIQSKRDGLE